MPIDRFVMDDNRINGVIPPKEGRLNYITLKLTNNLGQKSISVSDMQQASFLNMKVTSGSLVEVLAQIDVLLKVFDQYVPNGSFILPSMNFGVLGNPFSKNYNIEVSWENLVKCQIWLIRLLN